MDKQNEIIDMFNNIAPTYDKTNRVMSMGIDISWRKEACAQAFKILNKSDVSIIDVACGTGDMILHWEEGAKEANIHIGNIIGIDPSNGMLDIARKKIPNGNFIISQADKIPLDSNSADIISIAYGLRNVVERKNALDEFYRILKPNGVLVILEFMAHKNTNISSSIMQFYTRYILPFVGGIISRNFKAYKYLPNSIDNFITRQSLEAELLLHNMPTIFAKDYSAGISSLVIAKKG